MIPILQMRPHAGCTARKWEHWDLGSLASESGLFSCTYFEHSSLLWSGCLVAWGRALVTWSLWWKDSELGLRDSGWVTVCHMDTVQQFTSSVWCRQRVAFYSQVASFQLLELSLWFIFPRLRNSWDFSPFKLCSLWTQVELGVVECQGQVSRRWQENCGDVAEFDRPVLIKTSVQVVFRAKPENMGWVTRCARRQLSIGESGLCVINRRKGGCFILCTERYSVSKGRDKKVKRASMEGHTEQYFRGGRRSSCKRMSFSHQARIRSRAC